MLPLRWLPSPFLKDREMEKYRIRLLQKNDCREAAMLRLSAQEWGFLPAMGLSFQSELLKGTCESKWGFGLICVGENGKIVGLVYAATNLLRYYKSILLFRGPILAWWALLKLIKKPELLKGIVQYFIYPAKLPVKEIEAEWLTMVVDREHRNRGIAKALTASLIEEYRKRLIKKFRSTVAARNTVTCRLHDKFGFTLIGTFPLCGDRINVYKYKL
jgi:ribosomal protein S18 acetylase RimI-like enzyme